jgi:ATP-dependent RNA helicase RhlE
VHGGVEQDPQIERLAKGVDILVATPGRMFDLVSQGHITTDKIQILVLDEADHMLDLGFINDIRQLVKILPRKRQTLFFSATINAEIKKLAYSLVKDAIRISRWTIKGFFLSDWLICTPKVKFSSLSGQKSGPKGFILPWKG